MPKNGFEFPDGIIDIGEANNCSVVMNRGHPTIENIKQTQKYSAVDILLWEMTGELNYKNTNIITIIIMIIM